MSKLFWRKRRAFFLLFGLLTVNFILPGGTVSKAFAAQAEVSGSDADLPLRITRQPENVTVCVGERVPLSVSAEGTGELKYQWYYKKAGAAGWTFWDGHSSSSTSPTAFSSWNMAQVRCLVSDDKGSVYSDSAAVTVKQKLTITRQPEPISPGVGEKVSLKVSAQGTGELKYQWYYKKTGQTRWSEWQNKNQAVCTSVSNESWDGMQVYCRVRDESGSVDSATVKVTIRRELRVLTQPSSATVKVGEKATFTVKAEGTGRLTYQWYYRKYGRKDWLEWVGQKSATAASTADYSWNCMEIYCQVRDASGNSVNSRTALIRTTKKGNKRYIERTLIIKSNKTKVYSGPGTNYKCVGTVKAGKKYKAISWDSDSKDTTWYSFSLGGKKVWISRKAVRTSDKYSAVSSRSFRTGGLPVIYISPSRQTHNAYAAGSTNEGTQMYRVGVALRKILEAEYYCEVVMPPMSMEIVLKGRPYDAYNRDADVYLAIHSNANPSGRSYGATGYYFPGCAQSKKLGENMVKEMGKISFKKSTVKRATVNGMLEFDGMGYGEVRDPAYYGMVSLLAEVEFHDNADSAKWIINNPDKIARALANSLEKTFDLQKKQ